MPSIARALTAFNLLQVHGIKAPCTLSRISAFFQWHPETN